MLTNSATLGAASGASFSDIPKSPLLNSSKAANVPALISLRRQKTIGSPAGAPHDGLVAISPCVEIAPRDIATRRARSCNGMAAEVVRTIRRERIEIGFHASMHLLVIVEDGARVAGESSVEGLPPSSLRDLKRKLTFVPAAHGYHEWHQPSALSQTIYFYLDPAKFAGELDPAGSNFPLSPRLFFEDTALWQTALKLRRLIEAPGANSRLHFEALGVILAHELLRPETGYPRAEPRARGGLAGWQQRTVREFIEENLADSISIAKLADLVRLSPYHFCRIFKQSFGVPPHRYHTSRRIERAKALLANPDESVTTIGLMLGFSETSSFTTVFRKVTGMTPTAYRRGLG
jgi:AraC family transcriptional regulator